MPLVCFASPKGGVGRTILTATIGVALHRLGWRVLAIDLDRQNALHLNFELPEELRGIADEIDSGRDWTDLAVETPAGIFLVRSVRCRRPTPCACTTMSPSILGGCARS